MSKYTTEVRFLCEHFAGLDESKGFESIDSIIQAAIPEIFSFDFPIFDEEYRNVLCTKILKHYYTREICEEVYGLWKLRLENRLNEIMPKYNRLYESDRIRFDPLHDMDITTEHAGSGESISNGNNSFNGESFNAFSDTPQGSLQNVRNEEYLTNASKNTGNNNTNYNGKANTTDEYLTHVYGKTGAHTYSSMIREYRKTFLNIDKMVIDELEDLFFGLW